MTNHNLNFKFR